MDYYTTANYDKSSVDLKDQLQRAAGLKFTGDQYRTGAFMYSLGQLLGERAQLAEHIITIHEKQAYEESVELFNRYNIMIKQYLAIP